MNHLAGFRCAQETCGRAHAGARRHNDRPHPERVGDRAGMQRSRAPECDEHELRRIDAALDGHDAHPASSWAIEPPPAPTVCTSSAGSRIGKPATTRSEAGSGTRPRTRHTSVLVPPMSKLTASAKPHAAAISAAARTPPAGPDSNNDAAGAPDTGTSPPAEVMTSASDANAASCIRYGAHAGSRNASTTVVTMRSYSRNSGLTSCEHTTSSERV